MKTRIEIHLLDAEVETLDKIAEQDGRSRKNYCETAIRSIIQSFEGGQKKNKKEENEMTANVLRLCVRLRSVGFERLGSLHKTAVIRWHV